MFLRLLSATDKVHLIDLAELLALSDNPLLWDGKRREDITSETDLSKLTVGKEGQEMALLEEMKLEGEPSPRNNEISDGADLLGAALRGGVMGFSKGKVIASSSTFSDALSVEIKLANKLKTFPLHKIEEAVTRVEAATLILKELLQGKKYELLSVPKLMLFELILVALRDGHISNIEWSLLKEFQNHHKLEDFIFDDLLERAELMNREVSKTISIILE